MSRSLVLSSYFLAVIFLFAGMDKLFHYDGFLNALNAYRLPQGVSQIIALPLILAEICTGLGLMFWQWRRMAAISASGLLTLFTVVLAVNQYYQPGSICGCWFTLTLAQGTRFHIAQNIVMLILAVSIWYEIHSKTAELEFST